MRIAIDFTAFIPQMTWVDTYLKQLVLHLAKVDQHNQYMIYHNHEDRRFFADNLPANFLHTSLSIRPRLVRLISQQLLLPLAASAWKADVVHSPSFIMPYIRGSARHLLMVTVGPVIRKRRLLKPALTSLPLTAVVVTCHAVGEFVGYILGEGNSRGSWHRG